MTDQTDQLRREIVSGLDRMIERGDEAGDIAAELLKAAIRISIAANGVTETMEGMALLLRQIRTTWPDEWQSIVNHHSLARADVAGSA